MPYDFDFVACLELGLTPDTPEFEAKLAELRADRTNSKMEHVESPPSHIEERE